MIWIPYYLYRVTSSFFVFLCKGELQLLSRFSAGRALSPVEPVSEKVVVGVREADGAQMSLVNTHYFGL